MLQFRFRQFYRLLILASFIFFVNLRAGAQQSNNSMVCDSLFNAAAYDQACDVCAAAFREMAGDAERSDSLTIDAAIKSGLSFTTIERYREAYNIYTGLVACCFDPEVPDSNYLFVIQELAGISILMLDHQLVVDHCKEVIRVITYLGGPDDPALVNFYYTIGEKYLTGGNYAGAQQAFIRAAEIHRKYHPAPDLIYARIITELSSSYLSVGQPQKCIQLNMESLKILNESGEEDVALRSDIYQLLIWGYNGTGNIDSAIFYTGEVIDLSSNLPAFQRATALISSALYIINYDLSYGTRLAEENRFDNVLLAAQGIYDSIQPEQIYLNNLYVAFANYYITTANYDSTIYYYKKSLDITESGYGKNNIIYLNSLATLGRYYEVDGQFAEAEIVYDSLMAGSRRFLKSNFIFLSAGQQETLLTNFENNKDYVFSFYHRHNELKRMSEVFVDNELFMKGLLLQNITSLRNEILSGNDSASISMFNTWIELKKQLAVMSMNNRADTSNLESIANKLELQLAGKKISNEQRSELRWTDIRDGLNKDEAAIEYISFDEEGTTNYYAALLKRDSKTPELFFLGTGNRIDSLLIRKKAETEASYIHRIYSFPDPSFPEDSQYYAGQLLYNVIWRPFEQQLENIEKVYVAPSGILHQVAFGALPTDAENRLINRYDITQISSAKQLLERKKWNSFSGILLAGGINYNDSTLYQYQKNGLMVQSVELPSTETIWSQLPGTYSEVKQIGLLLAKAGKSTEVLTGSEPRESRFQSASLSSTDVLHLATHGYFYYNDDADFSVSGYKYKSSSNPLVRSGLLLAGGNYTWTYNKDTEGGNDGVLTADEISNLDLSNTELVVLSACETGLGDVRGSQGVYGLQRAFKMAGTGKIIMSLWQVPDRYTTELMELFYKYMLEGNSPEASLKHAQLIMQKKTGVYNWGAFILIQ